MIALALALAVTPVQDGSKIQSWTSIVQPGDWILAGSSDSAIMLAQWAKGPIDPKFPKAWIRTEYKNTVLMGSVVQLMEFDCTYGRTRTSDSVFYSQNNMLGTMSSAPPGLSEWSSSAPGTLGDGVSNFICGAAAKIAEITGAK